MGRVYQLLRKNLTGSLPSPVWPVGIMLDHYRPQHAAAIHAVLCEGYEDGSGHVADLASWRKAFETDAEFDPALCLVAHNAQGIVAVAQCWTSAYLKDLVVTPGARQQGLGRAMLLHVFTVFQRRGEAFVDLKVLESNQRARQLYESVGMSFVLRDVMPAD